MHAPSDPARRLASDLLDPDRVESDRGESDRGESDRGESDLADPDHGAGLPPTDAPLSARVVSRAVVNPTVRVASRPNELLMGVFDADGAYVPGTALDRRTGELGAPVPPGVLPDPVGDPIPEAIYAGPLYFHFGHFLLESLSRIWYAAQHPDLPLMFAGAHDWQGKVLKDWQQEILDILGLTNPTVLVADPTRVDRLHVPDIGFRYDDWFHPQHAAFLGRYAGPEQEPGERLWLSRSRIRSNARTSHPELIDRRLRTAGWTVINPETLTVRDQLDALARAELVAGEEGSAFHLLMLLADVSGKQFRLLRRHGPEHQSLHTIGDARAVRQSFHSLEDARVLEAKGRVVVKIGPDTSEVLDVLGVPVTAVDTAPTDESQDSISAVVEHLRPTALLEVGARTTRLLERSDAAVRVTVSTNLTVDPRAIPADLEAYELRLEEYVDHFHDERTFDVIVVTGRDLAGVMSSFRAGESLAHDDTVWILGVGQLATRAALAVETLEAGYRASRVLVGGKFVVLARRDPDVPASETAIEELGPEQLRRLSSRLPTSGFGGTESIRARGFALLGRLSDRRHPSATDAERGAR